MTNSTKKKVPGIAKFIAIIEIIIGTALIIFGLGFLTGNTAAQGAIILLLGVVIWVIGIFYFKFQKWAWYASLFYFILAVILSAVILFERINVLGMYFEEPEIIGSIIAIILNLIFLFMVLPAKKHLK